MADSALHEKHRQRMHNRVAETGFEGFSEHEVLEYLLYFAMPRRDTNPIAHALINHFGGFAQVLEASEKELLEVEGIGPSSARLIHSILGISRYYEQYKVRDEHILKEEATRQRYIRAMFFGQSNESFWIISLDERMRILRRSMINMGQPNTVTTLISSIAAEAVKAGASGVILAHNHPNGFASPSSDDIASTAQIIRALQLLNIHVLDHYIAAPDGVCSMKKRGNLPRINPITGEVCYVHEQRRV